MDDGYFRHLVEHAPDAVIGVSPDGRTVAFLRETTDAFDVIVAADVLIYFGDLTKVIAAMARVLSGLPTTKPSGVNAAAIRSRSGRLASAML